MDFQMIAMTPLVESWHLKNYGFGTEQLARVKSKS